MTKQQQQKKISNKQIANQSQSNNNNNPNQSLNVQHQQQQQQQINQQNRPQILLKKKIIKKFPFISNKSQNNKISSQQINDYKGTDYDELKNWKPVNFQSIKKTINNSNSNKQNQNIKTVNIASLFLSTLPKPKSNTNNQILNMNHWQQQLGLVKEKKKSITGKFIIQEKQQKQQWDGDDEFLNKPIPAEEYISTLKQQQTVKQTKFQEKQDENELIQKINWLNEKSNKKQVNIADLVNKTWQKQQNILQNLPGVYQDSSQQQGNNKRINKIRKTNK